MTGRVVHWQMLSADPVATGTFYQALFGWTVTETGMSGYQAVATPDGGPNGGIWASPPATHESVQLFVEVGDITAALATVEALGGTVLMPRQTLPDGDVIGLALDPLGRPFGMTEPRPVA